MAGAEILVLWFLFVSAKRICSVYWKNISPLKASKQRQGGPWSSDLHPHVHAKKFGRMCWKGMNLRWGKGRRREHSQGCQDLRGGDEDMEGGET